MISFGGGVGCFEKFVVVTVGATPAHKQIVCLFSLSFSRVGGETNWVMVMVSSLCKGEVIG